MSIFNKKKWIRLALVLTLASTLFANLSFANDYKGHWAQPLIEKWVDVGLIKGYSDGSFKPNKNITRAEIVSLINKSFGFKTQGTATFNDVSKSDWFYADVQKARLAGYISGYSGGVFKPAKNISREEIAFIISKLLKLKASNSATTYKDTKKLTWSKDAVGAVIYNGIMNGYEDQTFQPGASATRAEVVAILDRSLKKYKAPVTNNEGVYNLAGVYGDAAKSTTLKGTVQVNASGVVLVNTVIDGDLYLNEGIGDGDVVLNKVTVTGRTFVKGGGVNSIHFDNSTIGSVVVNKVGGNIRLVVSGTTLVKDVSLQSGARLEESNVGGVGFGNITLAAELPKDSKVKLAGDFVKVTVLAKQTSVEVTSGQINELRVDKMASNTKVQVSAKANVSTLQLDAPTAVSGEGTVEKANVTVAGSTIEKAPAKLDIAANVKVTVAGKEKDASSEGGAVFGGGFGGGADTPASSTGANTYLPSSKSTKGGASILLAAAPEVGVTAWFAHSGTSSFVEGPTMKKLTGNGVSKAIITPTEAGSYNLYLVYRAGNVLSVSTSTLTVITTVPTSQNTIFAASVVKKAGTITLNAAPGTGLTAWFAPANTSTFTEGATMTKSTNTLINIPTTEGTYYLYLVDEVGNASSASTANLTVDLTAPTNQNTLFNAAKTVRGGVSVTLNGTLSTGQTAWFAPSGTTSFAESTSLIKMSNGVLKAPQVEGEYRLYVLDEVENASNPSTQILKVDNTAPTNQNQLFTAAKSVKSGAVVALSGTLEPGANVWFAPEGTTEFSAGPTMTVSSNLQLHAPVSDAKYKLFVVDAAGNVSSSSTYALTVDNTPPTGANTAFATGKAVNSQTVVSIATVPNTTAWFAPFGTTAFSEGATMTKYQGGQLKAPNAEGEYRLFLLDEAGNVSIPSDAKLKVDDTRPTSQNALLPASITRTHGTQITLSGTLGAGETVWIAPAVAEITLTTVENSTMKKSTTTTIVAPDTLANYKVFVIDEAGNVSNQSTYTITIN